MWCWPTLVADAADRRELEKWIVRWCPPTKTKNFLGLIFAGFTSSFCLQDTYTFLLPFLFYWRVQLDCSCSVWSLARVTQQLYFSHSLLSLAVVFLEIAWFYFFRPAVVVSVKSRKNRFLPGIGTIRVYPSSSPKNGKIIMEGKEISMILPAVYVAHTGYFDKRGFPLYGLYAGAKILKGSVFPKGCSLIQVSLLYWLYFWSGSQLLSMVVFSLSGKP